MSVPSLIIIRRPIESVQETPNSSVTATSVQVARIQLRGPDANTKLTLQGSAASLFELRKSNNVNYDLELKAGVQLDFETMSTLSIQIVATSTAESGSRSVDFALALTDVNEAPVAGAPTSVSVPENGVAVGTFAAVDPDAGEVLTYTLTGADAARFNIDSGTGAVRFKSAPNFEVDPLSYSLNVVATDRAGLVAARSVTVTVTNVNEAPTAGAPVAVSVAENGMAVGTFAATDPDAGDLLTYTLGGADAARFNIDSATGALSFKAAPDFDLPADVDSDNVYHVNVVASDVGGLNAVRVVTVTVTPLNEAPVAGAPAAVSVAENSTAVGTFAATDPDAGDVLSYSLTGADATRFNIDSATGSLSFKVAPDFEVDARAYALNVVATDRAGLSAMQSVTVTVTNVNEAPTAGAPAAVSVAENGTAVGTFAATDPDAGDVLSYSLTGADATRFNIDSATGALSFKVAPDFEAPADTGANNVYDVNVVASDRGGLSATRSITVTVTNVDEGPPLTKISAVQGSGETSPLLGQVVTIQARVTAWKPGLNMFFLEEETADRDGNEATSEGIAVFYGGNNPGISAASIGDVVRLTGTVAEFKATGDSGPGSLTQLVSVSGFTVISDGTEANLDPATPVKLPIANGTTLERFEGMQIEVSSAMPGGKLFVADTFTFARFGEVTLYADGVPFQYTEQNLPSVAGNAAHQEQLLRNSIQIEDGASAQNPSLSALNTGSMILRDATADGVSNATSMGVQADSSVNFIRVGDTATSVTGVLSYGFGSYELQPTQNVVLTANPRPMGMPDVGAADVKVASFNVLNYFTTLGTANFTTPAGNSIAGRGATNMTEFAQQQAKIVAAMLATDADVFGINEIQNNGDGATSAIKSLVDALNAAVGSVRFAYISGHATGSDAIRVGIIYDATAVTPVGAAATPNTTTYSAFASSNRLPVAQNFQYAGDPSRQFTLVVNHLKSKGSAAGLPGDTDQLDGQGASNATRLAAAQQLTAWLGTNPTNATGDNVVLVGDLNAYRMEDPVRALEAAGYTHQGKSSDYSYVFDGLRGSLDHVLTKGISTAEVTGVVHFNINSDEQVALDYNDEFGDGSVSVNMDRNDAFRSSDHDPVVIGLKLNANVAPPPPVDNTPPTLVSSSPADNASSVAVGANIVLTFSEAVTLKSGYADGDIKLVSSTNGSMLRSLSAGEISISGSAVTLNPAADLAAGTGYAVQITAGALRDLAGNAFGGIADTTTLNFSTAAAGPVNPLSVTYTENFDSLVNVAGSTTNTALPAGWAISEAGGGGRDNEQYAVDTGNLTTGDTYSYGASGSTERALGGLQSGTLVPTIGASFTNTTGQSVTQFDLSYFGEQWRLGAAGRQDRLDFQYSTDATSLTTGTWIDSNALDFLAPIISGTAVALNGNAAANRVAVSGSVMGLSIAPGASIWIRWVSFDAAGADDGLAVDDVVVTLVGSAPAPTPPVGP